jgi:hypothetical protein
VLLENQVSMKQNEKKKKKRFHIGGNTKTDVKYVLFTSVNMQKVM